jgi:hypothetical protein
MQPPTLPITGFRYTLNCAPRLESGGCAASLSDQRSENRARQRKRQADDRKAWLCSPAARSLEGEDQAPTKTNSLFIKQFAHTAAFLLFTTALFAQKAVDQNVFNYALQYTDAAWQFDGVPDEPFWAALPVMTAFHMKYPQVGTPSRQTEVRMAHNRRALLISAVCYDTSYQVVRSLKRDTRIDDNDGISFIIDPVNKGLQAYMFSVTSAGVMADALVLFGSDDPDFAWDQAWRAKTMVFNDRFTVEIEIPLSSIRFSGTHFTWGLNVVRTDQKNNEISTWTSMPLQITETNPAFTGALQWDEAPRPPAINAAVIPYVLGGLSQPGPGLATETVRQAGGDIKFAVTPTLNLDLTVRPDFSNVDVDEQQTNLTRFELNYPERRQFFLENSDLFSNFGFDFIRPFFSRRIGIDRDLQPTPLDFGARLSGNVNDRLRIGAMTVLSAPDSDLRRQSNSVVSFQQQLVGRSSIRGIAANRFSVGADRNDPLRSNTNAGIEVAYANDANTTEAWANIHRDFRPTRMAGSHFIQTGFIKRWGNHFFIADFVDLGANYVPDLGFVQRNQNYDAVRDTVVRIGQTMSYIGHNYYFKPLNRHFQQHMSNVESYTVRFHTGQIAEQWNALEMENVLTNTASLNVGFEYNMVNLPFPFVFTSGQPLPAGYYHMPLGRIEFFSDKRPATTFNTALSYSRFFVGDLFKVLGGITHRWQPWGSITVNAEHNRVTFPLPYSSENLWLVGPRFELNFSKSLFWTTFVQYNTQWDNLNVNSRLQWRFAPMSDLFVVYTDNYIPDTFMNKNRGIVVKLNYWLRVVKS